MDRQKHIYVIRHAETDYNREGIIQGRGIDTSINEFGIQQARAFFEAYSHIEFSQIFISSQQRTEQTVAPFIRLGLPVERWPELDELHWGIHEGKTTNRGMREIYREVVGNWRTGRLDYRIPEGESIDELKARQHRFVRHLANLDSGNYLVCTHGRAMRSLLCLLTGRPHTEMDNFPHRNVCLYQLEFRASKWEVVQFNNTEHLNDLL